MLTRFNNEWDKNCIRLIKVNSAWCAASVKDQDKLYSIGLQGEASFLDYELLLNHVSCYGFCLETMEDI